MGEVPEVIALITGGGFRTGRNNGGGDDHPGGGKVSEKF